MYARIPTATVYERTRSRPRRRSSLIAGILSSRERSDTGFCGVIFSAAGCAEAPPHATFAATASTAARATRAAEFNILPDVFVVMQVIDPPLHHTTRVLSAEVARPEASRVYGTR